MKNIFLFVVLLFVVACTNSPLTPIVKKNVNSYCGVATPEAQAAARLAWDKELFPHSVRINCNSQIKSMSEPEARKMSDYTNVKSLDAIQLDDINVTVKPGADIDLVLAEVISLMATNEVNVIVNFDDLPFVFLHSMSEGRLTQQVQLLRNHLKAKLLKPGQKKTNVVTFANASNKLH